MTKKKHNEFFHKPPTNLKIPQEKHNQLNQKNQNKTQSLDLDMFSTKTHRYRNFSVE